MKYNIAAYFALVPLVVGSIWPASDAAEAEQGLPRLCVSANGHFLVTAEGTSFFWLDARRSAELPDGPRGSSYGCMGGMIRLPVDGLDILLCSNLDTDAGRMPGQVGASITKEREKISVWARLDGGNTWPVKRLVFDGPSG